MSAYPSQAVWASVQADAIGSFAASLLVDPAIRQAEREQASLEALWAQIKATLENDHVGQ